MLLPKPPLQILGHSASSGVSDHLFNAPHSEDYHRHLGGGADPRRADLLHLCTFALYCYVSKFCYLILNHLGADTDRRRGVRLQAALLVLREEEPRPGDVDGDGRRECRALGAPAPPLRALHVCAHPRPAGAHHDLHLLSHLHAPLEHHQPADGHSLRAQLSCVSVEREQSSLGV